MNKGQVHKIAILLALLCSMNSIAQSTAQSTAQVSDTPETQSIKSLGITQGEQQAKARLQSILSETNTFKAAFEQRIVDNEGQLLQSAQGSIFLSKPNQMRWSTHFPDETLLVADGESVYNLDEAVEQLTIYTQNDIAQNNPLMLLVSDDESKWASVSVTQTSVKNQFAILSLSEDANIKSVVVSFEKNKLIALESVDIQDQVNKLSFKDVSINIDLGTNAFSVDVPDFYIVDDQRTLN